MAQADQSRNLAMSFSKAETQASLWKSTRKRVLGWIAHWVFFIGFKVVGLFALWTFSVLFDEESRLDVKK